MSDNFNNAYGSQDLSSGGAATMSYEPVRRSNPVLGMVGSIIGSLLGVGVWILIDKMGFIAGISGVVMLLAAFKGYEILGGRLDRFGMIFSVVLSFIMIFVAVNVSLVMAFIEEFGADAVKEAGVIELLKFSWGEPELLGYILKDLAIGYALYLWAGFSYIKKAVSGTM